MGADCSETMAVWKKIAGEQGILGAGVPKPMSFEMRFEEGELVGKAKHEKADPVSNPAHYMGHTDVTCADALSSMLGYPAEMHYWQGCALKYLWRWTEKGGVTDLEKCRECVSRMIACERRLDGDGA